MKQTTNIEQTNKQVHKQHVLTQISQDTLPALLLILGAEEEGGMM